MSRPYDHDAVPLEDLPEAGPEPEPRLREALIAHLSGLTSPRRLARMEAVLARRTRRLTVVLEDVYQSHNASAVLRSCECFGLQEVHVVEGRNAYRVSRDVALGAWRWLDLVRWRAVEACCDALRARGYRLVAATPDDDAVSVDDLDVERGPVAILFGTELEGLTPAARARAGEAVHIPMQGFTQSLNLSVSAALILRELTRRLRASAVEVGLDPTDARAVLLRWLRRSLRGGDQLVARFVADQWHEEENR